MQTRGASDSIGRVHEVSASSGQRFPRIAGLAVPLFSLRGERDFGSGGILDLIPFIDWMARWDQRIVQLLPINEAGPNEASPYTTFSVFAIDPSYISLAPPVDVQHDSAAQRWLSGAQIRRRLSRLAGAARRDRQAVYGLKLRLLEFTFAEFEQSDDRDQRARFDRFCEHNARWLDNYALFRALKERRRWSSWESWPEGLRQRDPEDLTRAAAKLAPRMRFAKYLQWVAAEQWAAVREHARRRGVLLKGDLPFVCGRDSADVWANQALFDFTSSAGAPPDDFSATGQAWGLPLYNWSAMRAANYRWWRERVRQARDLYDIFRIDHVVGLYRTYAIPVQEGGTAGFVPADEREQQAQGEGLMRAILEEAGPYASVVAEDLGTVPDWVRASLTNLRIPGYKIFRWEQRDGVYIEPRSYPALSVATTGTHDTDTLVEWWNGLTSSERAAVLRVIAPDGEQPPDWPEVHRSILRCLYESGSALAIVPIQDLFGWPDRINVPATLGADNWSYRLPMATHELDGVADIRQQMQIVRSLVERSGRAMRQA